MRCDGTMVSFETNGSILSAQYMHGQALSYDRINRLCLVFRSRGAQVQFGLLDMDPRLVSRSFPAIVIVYFASWVFIKWEKRRNQDPQAMANGVLAADTERLTVGRGNDFPTNNEGTLQEVYR